MRGVKIKSLVGQRFTKLLVLAQYCKDKQSVCLCLCDCRAVKEIRAIDLLSGNNKSCGCLKRNKMREIAIERNKAILPKYSKINIQKAIAATVTHGMSESPEYQILRGMHHRCNDFSGKGYGHLGIKVYEGWSLTREGITAFIEHVGPRPQPYSEYSIDRYPDPFGNYEPGNVRWATWSEQANNRIPKELWKPQPPNSEETRRRKSEGMRRRCARDKIEKQQVKELFGEL